MTVTRYRNRTAEVEAIQWTGDNADALSAFCSPFDFQTIDPEDRVEDPEQTAAVRESEHGTWRGLKPGDWVVKRGEDLYECGAADFAKLYEPVGQEPTPNRTALRDRIRRAVCEAEGFPWDSDMLEPDEYGEVADAVLAVLPEPNPKPPTAADGSVRDQLLHALDFAYCQGLGYSTPENLLAAYDTNRTGADRTAVLRDAADVGEDVANRIHASGDDHRAGGAYDVVDELRRMADEAAVPDRNGDETAAKPWQSDSARIGRTLIWSWSEIGKGAYGEGYRAAQAEARALLGGQRGMDADASAVGGAQQPTEDRT
jgi:hypothetical protein